MAKSKYSKFVAASASAALVATAVAPVASLAASFKDVPSTSDYYSAVTELSNKGVINGYPDGTFKIRNKVTRAEAAKMLSEVRGFESSVSAPFNDVKKGSWYEKYVNALYAEGLVEGRPGGGFEPQGNLSRAEFSKLVVEAYDLPIVKDAKLPFKDLKNSQGEDNWAIDYISTLYTYGFINGKTTTTFAPTSEIDRGDMALLLNRVENGYQDIDFGAVSGVKAINATTVEVTYKEAVKDVSSLNYTIDGLTISNAALKQKDDKTVVLTTSTQVGGTKYTVKQNGQTIGQFDGVSAVIPTTLDVETASQQGVVGKEVTLKANVGVKQAGIPVTFNVKADEKLNDDHVVEVLTNADGIASFSYTQYRAGHDAVTAYPTGAPAVRDIGYVFWGVDTIVAVEQVTEGNTINNGANKTYKVTYKNPTTGKPVANKTFNVSVLENIGVTADKLQDVTVNGVAVAQLSNNTKTLAAQITTDSKGEATFTVSGTNSEATPVVFEAHNTTSNGVTTTDFTYDASDLQATASKVKFAAVQAEYSIDVTRDGGEVAATGEGNGRVYKVLVKDKAGNVAKNETVNVAFNEDIDRIISTNTKAKFVNPDTSKFYTGNAAKQISVKTNDKGEASFVIATDAGNENDYATPVAWIDINTSNAKQGLLDEGEPKTVAGITHFQAPYLDGAKLVAKKNGTGSNTSNFDAADDAVFSAELVNQSNKVFTAGYTIEKVTYTVFNTGAEDVIVDGVTISPNRSESFTKNGSLTVKSVDQKTTSVRVVATGTAKKDGKDFIFTAKEATATFTNSKTVATPYTGYVTEFNPADSGSNSNSLWFDGKDPIKYTGSNIKYFGANGNEIFGADAWETYLTSLVGQDVTISYSKDGDNTVFKVISVTAGTSKALKKHTVKVPNNAPVAKDVADQTVSVNGTPLTFTATQLATDADIADTLEIVTAYTTDASVATTTVAGNQLSFTVNPKAEGVTTVTVVVSDGKDNVNVNFKVNVTAASYTSVIGNPAREFVAAKASTLTLTNPTVTAAGAITISDNATTPNTASVNVSAGSSASDIARAINAQASSLVTAVVNGNDVELTSKVTGVKISTTNGTATGSGLTATGTDGAAVAAQYTFRVDKVPTSGDTIKVQVGTNFYEYTVTGLEGTTTGLANAIKNAASANNTDAKAFDAKFTVSASGDVVTITQKVAASTNDKLSVTAK